VDLAMGKQDSALNNEDPRVGSPGQQDYNKPACVAAVRGALQDYVQYDCADPNVVVRAFNGDGTTYLWCANVHTNEEYRYLVERMPVYKREKDRAAAEEEGRKFLRERGVYDKRVQTTLTLPAGAGQPAAVDLWTGQRLPVTKLPDGRAQVTISMERLGGTLLGLYPSAPAKVAVQAFPGEVKRGERGALDLRVFGEDQRLLRGLLPVRVEYRDPQGQVARTETLALRDGRAVLRFFPAKNEAVGAWTVTATDLATQLAGSVKVEVR
jgi:hypothetical protein